MADDEDDDFCFGQKEPPLVVYVKQILRNYTEGQFLKELTQNADDAGASTVKFLYDGRQHGTARLYRGEGIGDLSPYQGPALCAFNDATFQKNDWINIQNLSRSEKKDNPTKVGRFGMGFVSVYHVTDMPSIVSGNYLAFMDPSETLFMYKGQARRGRQLDIHKRSDVFKDPRFSDQFQPYKNLFRDHPGLIEGQSFNGAMFRFPLRSRRSVVSENVIDVDDVEKLFDLFADDGKILLLFLKNIRSITVGGRFTEEEVPLLFSARMSCKTKDVVQKSREDIIRSIKESKQLKNNTYPSFSTVFPMYIDVVEYRSAPVQYKWLVSVYLGGSDITSDMFTLATEHDRLPLVGVAMQLFSARESVNAPPLVGRTCCFLPLPPTENYSGLPVHVNADFGVSDDRRTIKWPVEDRNDEVSKWNKLLLQQLFPKAYAQLIHRAIELYSTGRVSVDCIYQTWPDMNNVRFPWSEFMCPELFNILLKEDVFFSEIENGKWIKINEAIFDLLGENPVEARQLIVRLLLDNNVPIVSTRKHPQVLNAVLKYREHEIQIITPSLVRSTLRNVSLGSLTRREKITLLEYLLTDNDFADLHGFELLPLADGSFCRFTSGNVTDCVFLSVSYECSMDLLPGLRNRFIDEDLDESLKTKIIDGSQKTGNAQVRELKPNMISTLIRDALPSDWSTSHIVKWYPGRNGHPPRCWLEKFWNFLQRVCKYSKFDMCKYEGITLIPISFSQDLIEIELVQLLRNSNIVVISRSQCYPLDPRLETILPSLPLIPVYLDNADFVTFRQQDIWKTYLHHVDPNDILRIFAEAGAGHLLQNDVKRLPLDHLQIFRRFLTDLRSMTPCQRQILLSIDVFEKATRVLGSSNYPRFQSAAINNKVLRTVIKDVLPNFPTEEIFLDISDEDSKILASKLRLQPCPREHVLCQMVRCTWRENGDFTSLIIWIMDRWDTFQPLNKQMIIDEIRNKPFIPLQDGIRRRASECFDPSDELLTELFTGHMDIFPVSPFDSKYRSILLKLGMKTRSEVKKHEVKRCAEDVTSNSDIKKGYALLQFLDENPNFLTDSTLFNYLQNHRWVPVEDVIENDIYPSGFPRFNGCHSLLKPNEAKSVSLAPLVGSTLPLVSNRYRVLSDNFHWESYFQSDIDNIYAHLQNIVKFVSHQRYFGNRLDTFSIVKILRCIYSFMQRNLEYFIQFKESDNRWVWTGKCFVAPRRISIQRTRHSLEPYVFMLDAGFSEYTLLFKAFGATEKFDDETESMLRLFEEIKEFHETHRNPGVTSERIEHDRDLAIQVIERIIDLNKGSMGDEIRERIFLPVAVPNSDGLQFASCNNICYPNEEMLECDEFGDIKLVHEKVSRKIYNCLGVIPLAQMISGATTLFGFQQAGQKEDLIQKLKNILDSGYTEDAIANEMIQNADDVGATEVMFMIDMRTNSALRSRLLDKGMESWQGPALWVYNNATFSDADFENITKVGGRTKGSNQEQIGKFGLGFNSVYNITDVPSFLSRGLVGFFDPHTTFLDSQLRDKGNPGIRIDLNQSKTTLKRFMNQFKPYHGIFGCNLFDTNKVNFDGTLFRLPLRAIDIESQISEKHFQEDDILRLMKNVNDNSEKLLLFTQHITKVSVYYLGSKQEPKQAVQLFSVTKTPKEYMKEINRSVKARSGMEKFDLQNCILREASQFLSNKSNTSDCPSSLTKLSVEHCLTQEGAIRYRTASAGYSVTEWLVFSSMGQSKALDLYKSDPSRFKIPCGGVAIPLLPHSIQGEVFCFLPLSIPTCGIPCHINGNFEVSNDRRHLWRRVTLYGVRDLKSDWNDAIFSDIINRSYVSLLNHEQAQRYLRTGSTYYDLWPDKTRIPMQSEYLPLLKAFYRAIVFGIDDSGDKPRVFNNNNKWLNFDAIVIYKPGVQAVANDVKQVLQRFITHGVYVVDVPDKVILGFESADCGANIHKKIYTEERFFEEIFFPNIMNVESETRDKLTMHVIDHYTKPLYRQLLETTACIPTNSKSRRLEFISDVVHPRGKVSTLFEPEEHRFPIESYQRYVTRMEVMVELGMVKDDLCLPELLKRARVLEKSKHRTQHRMEKIQCFMKFLETKRGMIDHRFIDDLLCIQMLPVLKRPVDFPEEFPWYGDECGDFLCASELHSAAYSDLVCFVKPIIDEDVFRHCQNAESVSRIFNLSKQMHIPLCYGVRQLKLLIATNCTNIGRVYSMYIELMEEIQKHLRTEKLAIKESLRDLQVVLCSGKFMNIEHVALSCNREFQPYLYRLPDDLRKYEDFFRLLGMEDDYRPSTLLDTSYCLQHAYDEKALKDKDMKIAIDLAHSFAECNAGDDERQMLVPDRQRCLRPVSQLSFCLHDSSDDDIEDEILCHELIPHVLAASLGVKDIRARILSRNGIKLNITGQYGTKFGQTQKLTNRINEILKGYPCDDAIFKELLQNSDDAGADEINFIYDPRQHPDKKVFCESWKETLGPALCVFNNKPFTEDDLKGIQDLGSGSKATHPDKTGQYGIGFNSVYHLTDCPAFLTNDDTLCIFDPRCAFIDHSTADSPGFQYNIIPKLNDKFRDALSCFRLDSIQNPGCTMFRFPLRTTKMNTYANSKNLGSAMSQEVFDGKKLQNLLDIFKSNAFDMLLYLNNLKMITISHIDERKHKMKTDYFVKAELSKEDEKKRHEFYDYVKECAKKSKLEEIMLKEVTYEMKISDSEGKTEVWLANQRIGSTWEIPPSISSAYDEGCLKLLPRGGVAARLSGFKKRSSCIYCFLPLPIDPNLPVNVNGHFSLDPSRRNLSNTSQNSAWNSYIMLEVISNSYSRLLEHLRDRTFGSVNGSKSQILCTSQHLHDMMRLYWRYFPNIYFAHSDWKELAEFVFLNFLHNQMSMFPVVRRTDEVIAYELDDPTEINYTNYTLEWFPATGAAGRTYFDTEHRISAFQYKSLSPWDRKEKTKKMLLKPVLQHIGFNISTVPNHIYKDLTAAGKTLLKCNERDLQPDEAAKCQSHGIELVSPDAVVKFLKTDFNPGPLPCDVSMSRLQSEWNYLALLEYIASDGKLRNGDIPLDGMPLLLTQDSFLRKFNTKDTYFLSRKHALLPKCWHEFVHESAQCHFSNRSFQINHLGISDLVARFDLNLDPRFNANHRVPWDQNSDDIPTKLWIQELWDFLKEEFDKSKKCGDPCAHIKSLMGNWAVFPVKVTLQREIVIHYLMPFSSADSLLHKNITDSYIRDAFAKMELPVIDDTIFTKTQHSYAYGCVSQSNIIDFITRFVATANTPERILTSLVSLLNDNDRAFDVLDSENKKNILLFFVRFIGWQLNQKHSDDLRRLPCYLSIHKEYINLDRNKLHFVLHSTIPKVEKEQWVTETNAEFIKEDDSLKKLHELLGLTKCTEHDVYKYLILPLFHKFTHEARIEHMQHIRTILQLKFGEEDRKSMISCLKNTPLISHEGKQIKCICEFYHNSILIFKLMLQREMFLPEPFCDFDWLPFMIELGLVTAPTPSMILEFAQAIEGDMGWCGIKKQTEKSKALINHIADSKELKKNTNMIRNLRGIAFLVPHTLHTDMLTLHKRYKEHECGRIGISYDSALTPENEHLVWTSANLLPYYANPFNSGEQLRFVQLLQELNASNKPSLNIVLMHIKNLCANLRDEYSQSKRSVSRATSFECQRLLHQVMESIYTYLWGKYKETRLNEAIVKELKDEPIMLVDDDKRLIKAKYTVKTVKRDLVLQPYIYQIPDCFVPYMELFSRIGAEEKPSVWQCCELLTMIHVDIKDNSFRDNPNITSMIKYAVPTIFKSYQKDDWLQGISTLYLPNRRGQLVESSTLKYYDKPMFEVRMKKENDKNILFDFKEIQMEYEATVYIQNMPTDLQPCKFSKQVKEVMSSNPEENMCRYAKEGLCEQQNAIRRQLQSIAFRNGIYRLMKHEASKKGMKLPETVLYNVPEISREYLSIQCLHKLETHLVDSDEIIEGSMVERHCFHIDPTAEGQGHQTIFIRHEDSGKYDLLKFMLAKIISALTGELINDVMTVAMMMCCELNEIQTMLSNRNIQRLDTNTSESMSLPDLGSRLPDDVVESLENDPFNDFTPGEYVVYELSEIGEEVYVYAKIVRRIIREDSGMNSINSVYEIDYGSDNKEVSALHLYKWLPRISSADGNHHEEMVLQAMVDMSPRSNNERSAPQGCGNLIETKEKLSDKLEEIWKLGDEERKKAVRRFYLKWHPDKNPDREEFCSEVFKHLITEIDRLENGLPRNDDEAGRNYYYSGGSGTWRESFTTWNRRAGRDKRRREYYGYSSTTGTSFSSGASFSSEACFNSGASFSWSHADFTFPTPPPPSPMPCQGKLWQKQAREDFRAAQNDINGYPSYEWVAYKCLQAAEKSMKAAILSSIGKHYITHNIRWLSITVSDLPGCPNGIRKPVDELYVHGKGQNAARYPRLFDNEIPHELFDRNDAYKCISNAKKILDMMDILIASQ